jgi:uncharacterized delta-60 repeat protein
MWNRIKQAVFCLGFYTLSSAVSARESVLDESFLRTGFISYGVQTGGLFNQSHNNSDVAVDASGRVITIGFSEASGNLDCSLFFARADGLDLETLDRRRAFDRGGSNVDQCTGIKVLADGKLLVSGLSSTAGNRFSGIVARLNIDGSLDTTYADSGVFEVNAQIPWLAANETTLLLRSTQDAQGRVLVAGRISASDGLSRGLLLRFNADGNLDTTFGVDGAVPLADFNPPRVSISAVTVASSGLIYAAGSTENPGLPRQTVIFRLLDSGAFDLSYGSGMNGASGNGGGGRGFTGRCDRVGDIAVDVSNRVILGCLPDESGSTPGPILAPGILRLNAARQPDNSFSGDGLLELVPFSSASTIGTVQSAPRIALTDDGKITAAATLVPANQPNNPSDAYVARFLSDGTRDFFFGYSNGVAQLQFAQPAPVTAVTDTFAESISRIVLDPRGRPLLVGARNSGSQTRFLVARLGMADPTVVSGFLDPDFGSGRGFIAERFNEILGTGTRDQQLAQGIAVNASGKITTVGRVRFDPGGGQPLTSVCTVQRMLPDGQPDLSFNGTGRRSLGVSSSGANQILCVDVLSFDDDSSLIVGGVLESGNSVLSGTVIRLLANGQVDSNFFGNGVLGTASDLNFQALNRNAQFQAITRDSAGRILVAGITFETNAGIFEQFGIVLRLNSDLSVDTSFGQQGLVRLTTSTNPRRLFVHSVKVNANGLILVTANEGASADGNLGPAVYRLLDNGAPDSSFPNNGYLRLRTACPAGTDSKNSSAALDQAQRLVLTCYRSSSELGVLRVLGNGQVDINFGVGGFRAIRFTNSPGATDRVRSLLPLADGKLIVVGGHSNPPGDNADRFGSFNIGVQRLLDNGNPDPDFGTSNGGNLFRFPGIFERIGAIATDAVLQANQRLLVLGVRQDNRIGSTTSDRDVEIVLRVGNVAPAPALPEDIFQNGFE